MKPWPILLGLMGLGCGSSDSAPGPRDGGDPSAEVTPPPDDEPWGTLAEWNLFAEPQMQEPRERVVPYDVIAPLFSDYALKERFLWIPPGKTIAYDARETWDFPTGTILVKTFKYPADFRDLEGAERLLETRLLVRRPSRWFPYTYVWNEDQTEAVRKVAGGSARVEFVDERGESVTNDYAIPNQNECLDCHGDVEVTDTLGGRTRQLDRDFDYGTGPVNQIDHLTALGLFDGEPPPQTERERLVDPFGDAPLDERARAYMDANCGSCHDETGEGSTGSGLRLDWPSTDPGSNSASNWGVCKIPTSAGGATCGLTFDIVPGEPERSIFICRVTSDEREVRMPPLGRNLEDRRGVELMQTWIESMSGQCE